MIDLAMLKAELLKAWDDPEQDRIILAFNLALVAELDAARSVVAEARGAAELLGQPESYNLEQAINRYDEALKSGGPDADTEGSGTPTN